MQDKRGLQPDNLAEEHTGFINETYASVFEVKHLQKNIPSCATLETYDEMPIIIPVDITEDAFKLVVQNLSGSYGPGGTELEVPQRWILKFGEDIKRLCMSRHGLRVK